MTMSNKKTSKEHKSASGVVNVAAAKAKLSQYLARAKRGEETIVTEFRVPVAKIVPFIPVDRDFEVVEPSVSLAVLKEKSTSPGKKRNWNSLDLLLKGREE